MKEETKNKISKALKGRMPKNIIAGWNKGIKGSVKANKGSFKKGEHRSTSTEFKKGMAPWNKGLVGYRKGEANNKWKGGPIEKICLICKHPFMVYPFRRNAPTCSMVCMGKLQSITSRGPNSRNWKGGITPYVRMIRASTEYKEWRNSVFKRDDFACQSCKKRGGVLHAHHIKSFANFPEFRLVVSNGQTLCKPCHEKTDTFAGRSK